MSTSDSSERGTPAWWNQRYRDGTTPWDSGIVPPELLDLAGAGRLPASGTALDLGCGTGTNAIYLATLGLQVYGVDVSWLALAQARRKAQAAGAGAHFCVGDVADLDFLPVRAGFALDIGCLHALSDADRQRYVASLARRLLPGSLYLMYGFDRAPEGESGPRGFAAAEVAARFAGAFRVLWRQPSSQDGRPVAWHLLERT